MDRERVKTRNLLALQVFFSLFVFKLINFLHYLRYYKFNNIDYCFVIVKVRTVLEIEMNSHETVKRIENYRFNITRVLSPPIAIVIPACYDLCYF